MSFDREESAFDHSLVNLFNAELSPEMCSRGPRCCGEEGVGGERETIFGFGGISSQRIKLQFLLRNLDFVWGCRPC